MGKERDDKHFWNAILDPDHITLKRSKLVDRRRHIIMNKTIAILGGTGFVGSHLANYLSSSYKVRVVDVAGTRIPSKPIEFVQGDITRKSEMEKALTGVDFVVNCAVIQIPRINSERKLAYDVNVNGTKNLCTLVVESETIKGMVAAGTWHVIGEVGLTGLVNEEFGFRPDKVEARARYYALLKIAQETTVRSYAHMFEEKVFGVIRLGTVLGEDMPKGAAAQLFITKGLSGEPITPYRMSMYRPMLYVNVKDICKAFERFIGLSLSGKISEAADNNVVNLYSPYPITILELAETVRELIIELSAGRIKPEVKIVEDGVSSPFTPQDKTRYVGDVRKANQLLGIDFMSPRESLRSIIESRMKSMAQFASNSHQPKDYNSPV